MSKTKKVQFPVKRRMAGDEVHNYCQCDGCFKVGRVFTMKFPKTCYWNGVKLSTKYIERWYCDECMGLLFRNIRRERAKWLFDEPIGGE